MQRLFLVLLCAVGISSDMSFCVYPEPSARPIPVMPPYSNGNDSGYESDDESSLVACSDSYIDTDVEMVEFSQEEQPNRRTITCLTDKDWDARTTMRLLDFSGMQLTSIKELKNRCQPSPSAYEPPLFPYETLTTITLAHNCLQGACAHDFDTFKNLKKLDLSHNKLTTMDFGSFFKTCPRLKELNVSHNAIKTIAWSAHPVWEKLYGEQVDSLPRINCIDNPITQKDQEWLQERYNVEYSRLEKSLTMPLFCMKASGCGSLTGTVVAGVTLTVAQSAYGWFATPLGCLVGAGIGLGLDMYMAPEQENVNRIYFKLEDMTEDNRQDDDLLRGQCYCQWPCM